MKYCTNCGSPMEDGIRFCTECGHQADSAVSGTNNANQGYNNYGTSYDNNQSNNYGNYYAGNSGGYTGNPEIYGGGKPPKKGKKRIIAVAAIAVVVIAALVMVFAMGGGSKDAGDPNVGRYTCTSFEAYGISVPADPGDYMELFANGKCIMKVAGEEVECKWEVSGTTLTLTDDSATSYRGVIEDGAVTLSLDDVVLYFVKEGSNASTNAPASVPEAPVQPAATEAPTEPVATEAPSGGISSIVPNAGNDSSYGPNDLQYWAGDWYGWWTINEVHKGNTDMQGMWWDCVGRLEIEPDGSAWMVIWDDTGSINETTAYANMQVSIVDNGVAEFYSIEGAMFEDDFGSYEWYGATNDDVYGDVFWITADFETETDAFTYTFYMRPWGTKWDDVLEREPELMPYYYYDWYLPLIESGVTQAPDTIG